MTDKPVGQTASQMREYAANHPRTKQPKRLADFDRLAATAAERLSYQLWGGEETSSLIALARDRFLLGYDLYPNGPLFKMGSEQLIREAREELADGINYKVQEIVLEEERADQPSMASAEIK